MKLIITDISVLFDLYLLEILPEFFALKAVISTTSFVVKANQVVDLEVYNRSEKLNVITLTAEELDAANEFATNRNLKSIPDKTMLWKSIQLNCALLTCDRKLKLEAQEHGLEVHGSIWVIEELPEENILNTSKTISLLEKLKTVNERLPIDEIIKRLKV